jgi:hypothetical protein
MAVAQAWVGDGDVIIDGLRTYTFSQMKPLAQLWGSDP